MALNVNRSVSDAFYRYKMPRLLAKVEGKGNGIKTVIVNMVEIAKSLGRPPTYPTKYFGCELGAQTQFDFKDERFIVNGSHDASKLQDLLDGFIKKFVLCPECDNPETTLIVQAKKGVLGQSCKACGYSGTIKGGHRLITFIIKNPPSTVKDNYSASKIRVDGFGGLTSNTPTSEGVNPATLGASLTEGKRVKGRSKHKNNGEANGDASPPRSDGNGADISNDFDDDDDDWAVDVSEAAVLERQKSLSEGVKALAVTEDIEKPEKDRMDIFYKFLESKLNGVKAGTCKLDDKVILNEAERLDVRTKAALILAELLFDQNILTQLKTYRVILLRFCHENQKCQKYLIGGVEQVINLHKDQLLPKVPVILKGLYDLDIIDEEVLIEWHSKVSKKYVSKELSAEMHAKAEPFIKWLKEAEEEDEEEDSDEDDVEIEYDDRARVSSIKDAATATPAAMANGNGASDGHGADEVDIDAI